MKERDKKRILASEIRVFRMLKLEKINVFELNDKVIDGYSTCKE
jgi:hypothetical protein